MDIATLDRPELDRFARSFEELFYRGDAATMAAFYTEDAEPVRGQRAIEAFWTAATQGAQRIGIRRAITVRQVECSGGLGYVLSTEVLDIPTADGRTTSITFNDVTVWKQQADGGWRVVVDSANRSAPLETPPRGPGIESNSGDGQRR